MINDQTNTLGNWAHRGTIWWLKATCKLSKQRKAKT